MKRDSILLLSAVVVLGLVVISGCGVKGKPLPPLSPAEIGRGVPTYKGTAEQAKPKIVPEAPTEIRDVTPSPTPRRRGGG
ncbi:MAG: hypothetical protein RBT63_07765 [Bdellovibrionales bacterium]|jgi:hypothetical protein|nr:hypothetical protein [Bdellovibrionales bacterium]